MAYHGDDKTMALRVAAKDQPLWIGVEKLQAAKRTKKVQPPVGKGIQVAADGAVPTSNTEGIKPDAKVPPDTT